MLNPAVRVALYLPALGVAGGFVTVLTVLFFQALALPLSTMIFSGTRNESLIVAHAVALAAVVLVTWSFRRYVDRRSFVSLGLGREPGWVAEGMVGFALGALLMSLILLGELGLRAYRLGAPNWRDQSLESTLSMLVLTFLGFVLVAFSEELVARGYILQNLSAAWGTPSGVLVSSLLFSLGHLLNPGAGLVSSLGLFSAGLLFAVAYLVTRRLWLPMGLHLSWNFFQGPIFGFPVSGLETPALFRLEAIGPAELTGGEFGPEASLLALAADGLGIGILWAWAKVQSAK
jgi:uncharacterized protein